MKNFILVLIVFFSTLVVKAQVTTLYGNGTNGYSVGGTPGSQAEFNNPYGAAYDTKGNLWITDQGNNYIVLILASDKTYQLREGYINGGFNDGGSASQNGGVVHLPAGVVVAPGKTSAYDQIYLCDGANNAIRKIDSFVSLGHAQLLTTVSGGAAKSGKSGYTNGSAAASLFNNPTGIGFVKDASGGYLVVADKGNNAVRKVSLHKSDYGTTSDIATGFHSPEGIFVGPSDNIYVAESQSGGGISVIAPSGKVTSVIPGGQYLAGPSCLTVVGTDMYIGDGCRVMYFDMTKSVSGTNPSVFAGNKPDTICDFNDGTNATALFFGVTSISLAPDSSSLTIVDAGNNRIRSIAIEKKSGIANISDKSNTFNVYPNPAYGHIMINSQTSGKAVVSLFNSTGQQIMTNNIELIKGSPYDMSLEQLPPAIYVLQVSNGTGVYSQKIVVK